jgi:hypothetical protein
LTTVNNLHSRPPNQRTYIASVELRATRARVKEFAFADPRSLALYILNVDQVIPLVLAKRPYLILKDSSRFANLETVTGVSPRSTSSAEAHMALLLEARPFYSISLR